MKELQNRWTILHHDPKQADLLSLKGLVPESWLCVDCGVNTAPGCQNRKETELAFALKGKGDSRIGFDAEVYHLKNDIWKLTGLEGYGGCLCIGCVEKRIGRRLKPQDFDPDHSFNQMPGTRRLLKRRGR